MMALRIMHYFFNSLQSIFNDDGPKKIFEEFNMTEKSSNPRYVLIEDEKMYKQLIDSKNLTVIHFFAPWSELCGQMCDAIEEMLKLDDFKEVNFGKIQAEDLPEISIKDGVAAVPTVILYKNGNIVDRVDGVNPVALVEKTRKQLSSDSPLGSWEMPAVNLEARLKKLINQHPCMLFMKGNPATPRCGFSRTIVALLDSYKADYQTFDILEDNVVREGLKKFSDWPTYPQLYIKGELIGGLDIVKELSESGALEEMLPKKSSVEDR
ncbi:glutaredoxin 3 [Belonocnema kinseyi]|uniref:glutaredoxin 3 n=1 Tax=Belonocnema kinseyi TaxID=2817044 RepID=UPI00143DED75|nr:glutaredoxin 3 [Belonocnema kinseyi]